MLALQEQGKLSLDDKIMILTLRTPQGIFLKR
ncbi:hypothetical protein [Paenibacillus sp. CMAA1364]